MFLRLIAAITNLTQEMIRLRKVVGLRMPGMVFVKMVSEGKNGMSKFILVLPESTTADVIEGGTRKLSFSVNGGDPIEQIVDGDSVASDEFDGLQGQIVTGTLIDIDDADNPSPPRDFEVELKDTIAPDQPNEVFAKMVSE